MRRRLLRQNNPRPYLTRSKRRLGETHEHSHQTDHSFLARILRTSSAPHTPASVGIGCLTFAFNSPTFPLFAKCTLKLAFVAPPATPHRALSDPERHKSATRIDPGKIGEQKSRTMPRSLNAKVRQPIPTEAGVCGADEVRRIRARKL